MWLSDERVEFTCLLCSAKQPFSVRPEKCWNLDFNPFVMHKWSKYSFLLCFVIGVTKPNACWDLQDGVHVTFAGGWQE